MKTTEQSEIENIQDGTKYRLDSAEDKISKLEDIALEAVQSVIYKETKNIWGKKDI